MGRFHFRLEALRRLREVHRDEQRTRLAMAYEAERILGEQRAELAAEERALAAVQRALVQSGETDVSRLLSAQRYRLALEAQACTLAEQAERVAQEVERRRQAAVEADREVRVLDKLEERQRQAHRVAVERAEAKRLDEIAASRWEASEP